MNNKLEKALKRLNDILPLKKSQDKCAPEIKELHQQILRSFVINGRILTQDEMAQWVHDVPEAVNVLSQYDMVTFSESGEPVGAYPFTMMAREHKVQVNGHQIHAMCALDDALAIGPMFGETTQITSQCRVTGKPVKIDMCGETILNQAEVQDVHFGIAWSAAAGSCCADSLCLEMNFLCDIKTAQKWLADDADSREIFTLLEAVQFASRFFVPLLS